LKRIPFLPLFFTALGVVFAAAVWLRLRAYEPVEMANAGSGMGRNAVSASPSPGSGTDAPLTSADYTIVSADPASESAAARSASASARERRYQELLRSGPPPAAPPPKKAEPSFLNRVVAPIANALGMGPKPEAQAPPPRPAPQRERPPEPSRPSAESTATMADENADDDPDTDVMAPQLMSVSFVPSEVPDGESTTLTIVANDNRSGVRTVSGVIASPSGSMQGFACTREADSNQFITRVAIPKDAPAGVWQIKYLTILDNASNSAHLNAAAGALPATAKFTVTSGDSDAKGPQLNRVWLEKDVMRAGERNTLFVDAEDEKSGVALVSGVFVSPSRIARIGFGCRAGGTGAWECAVTPPTCLDCGIWKLEQIQLQDKANNLTTFRNENQHVGAVTLDIAGERCDAAAPVVTQFLLTPTVVSNAEATVIRVQAQAIDDGGCGVASLSGLAVPPGGIGGQRRYISFEPSPDGQNFTGKLEIPQFAAKGQWTIAWIQALDKGHNLRAYSSTEPVVSRATFRVE
jgi:hypothetical protein